VARREEKVRILLSSGEAVTATVSDGLVIDDIMVQGMKAEAYRVVTGKDVFPDIGRDLKDYLIRTGVILD
jgi:hypothetical protein